jgi:hypothetical protein
LTVTFLHHIFWTSTLSPLLRIARLVWPLPLSRNTPRSHPSTIMASTPSRFDKSQMDDARELQAIFGKESHGARGAGRGGGRARPPAQQPTLPSTPNHQPHSQMHSHASTRRAVGSSIHRPELAPVSPGMSLVYLRLPSTKSLMILSDPDTNNQISDHESRVFPGQQPQAGSIWNTGQPNDHRKQCKRKPNCD